MGLKLTIPRIQYESLKLFSNPDFEFSTTHSIGIIQQLVKLMNIYQGTEADNNLRHWIIETLQNVYLKTSYNEVRPRLSQLKTGPQSLFVLGDENLFNPKNEKEFRSIFGNELLESIEKGNKPTSDNFIKTGIKRAEGEGGNKYGRYFRNLENDKDFIPALKRLIKFISLCLAGQLSPNENFYNNKIDRLKINYLAKNVHSVEEIRAIIISCLISYFESNGIFDYSKNLSLYTDPNFNG